MPSKLDQGIKGELDIRGGFSLNLSIPEIPLLPLFGSKSILFLHFDTKTAPGALKYLQQSFPVDYS